MCPFWGDWGGRTKVEGETKGILRVTPVFRTDEDPVLANGSSDSVSTIYGVLYGR